jgi:hypothetical protein
VKDRDDLRPSTIWLLSRFPRPIALLIIAARTAFIVTAILGVLLLVVIFTAFEVPLIVARTMANLGISHLAYNIFMLVAPMALLIFFHVLWEVYKALDDELPEREKTK